MSPLAQVDWPAALAPGFDAQCLARYHVAAPCTETQAVASTLAVLQQDVAEDFALYLLPAQSGFVGVEPSLNFLTTFSLYPGSRTRVGAAQLWSLVANLLRIDRPVRTAVYARNSPARRFLRRAGFRLTTAVRHPGNGRMLLLYTLNAYSLCPQAD